MSTTLALDLLKLEPILQNLTVSDLKWYAAFLPEKLPTRKGDLAALLLRALLQPGQLRQLWGQLSAEQQYVVAEVVHNQGGRYNGEILRAKYPNVPTPQGPPSSYYGGYGRQGARQATAFEMFFYRAADYGTCIPYDVAALLRAFVPQPPKARMRSYDEMP